MKRPMNQGFFVFSFFFDLLQVREGRRVVDQIVRSQKVTYGINTGFGNFANTVIPADKLSELQVRKPMC